MNVQRCRSRPETSPTAHELGHGGACRDASGTTIENAGRCEFDPDAVSQLKATSADDLSVGGPSLARHAFEAALVDELHLFLVPYVVGSGKRALPASVRLKLELLAERRFGSGVVHLHYRTRA
jgi:riboflavin biosynthesis pyrimidine reductase